ncbi:MAG: hypothetical protein ABL901_18230 [Hyphomicrobiaceae bacterium]
MLNRAMSMIAIFLSFTSAASAKTCEQLAQACLKQGGVPTTCFDENRMKRCISTSTYSAPNGSAYPASKK